MAAVVNVDFNLGATPTYTGLGAAPDALGNTHWNGLALTGGSAPGSATAMSTFTGLLSSDHSPSGLSLTVQRTNQADIPGAAQASGHVAADLLRDYVFVNSGNPTIQLQGTITISGLTAGAKHDLYLYGAGGGIDQNTVFTIGARTLQTTGPSAATSVLTEGEDYVRFSGILPDQNNQILFTYANVIDDAAPSQAAAVNGLQIVIDTTESEPLLGIRNLRAGEIQLSWATNTSGYELQTLADLRTSAWNVVTNTPDIQGSDVTVTLSASNFQRYFRLYKP